MQVFVLNNWSNKCLYKVFNSIEAIKEHVEPYNCTVKVTGSGLDISIEIEDQYGIPNYFGYNTEMIEWFPITPRCEECGLIYCECREE